jgi:parvulin-like peptidyl-prolyl isomerase
MRLGKDSRAVKQEAFKGSGNFSAPCTFKQLYTVEAAMKFANVSLAIVVMGAVVLSPGVILAQNYSAINLDTLAMVNGSPITRQHVDQEKRLLNAAKVLGAQGDLNGPDGVSESELLEHLIDRELIVQQAMAGQVKVYTRHVNDAMQALKKQFDDSSGYGQYLLSIGMTETQLTEHLRTGLMVKTHLQNQLIQKVRVSDAELRSFYSRHPDDFVRPDQVRALHLLVAVTDEEQRGKALLKLQSIQLKLAQGADFGIMALENSDCPSRARGGDLGYFTYNQIIAPVAEVAFTLQPGQTSHIIESHLGYHLIKTIDCKPPSPIAFKDVRAKIERTIRRNKENRVLAKYIAGLRKHAEIVRYSTTP